MNKKCCKNCNYLKCYAILYKNYYCNHEDRMDDMGKLTNDNLYMESPKWCPVKEETNVR